MNILNRYGLEINKCDFSDDIIHRFKDDLTVFNDKDNIYTHFYYEDKDKLYVPKLSYNMNNSLGLYVKESFIEDSKDIKYYKCNKDLFSEKKMLIEPRNEIQKDTMDFLLNSKSKDKSLFLSPGTGKTAMSIMYFVNKKIKPLIILPDSNLMKQWKDSILEFTNITEDEIFMFENGSNSFKSKNFSNNKLVYICCIKTPASMISKSDNNELLQLHKIIEDCKIDIKIFDECHLNLNAIFKTTIWLPTIENLFLSGTMNRSSLKENIIHPGIVEPNECIESTEYEVNPDLLAVFFDSKPSKRNVYYCQDMAQRGLIDYNRYFNTYLLSNKHKEKLDVYFQMIENMCDYFIYKDNRNDYKNKIIIVAYTIDFLNCLYEVLKNKYRVCRMYSKYKEKPKDENFDIIIGTNKMLTAGFDKKSLNIMISTFMNTSSHNIKQLIGRVCRSYKNKPFAQYVCLVDTGFSSQIKYFEKHKLICENELSLKEKLQFKYKESKYVFPFIEEKKKEN